MGADPKTVSKAHRVCFFAHYNPSGIVAGYVWAYLAALRETGFAIVFISTSPLRTADERALRDIVTDIMVRANRGLDFGGWIEACRTYFPLTADVLLFANDSVYAPAGDFGAFLERLLAVPADFYGAVESGERGRHLQSWFLMFRPSAYRSDAFRSLMLEPMPALDSKAGLIERYEIGLTRRLSTAGLAYHAAFSPLTHGGLAAARAYNAMHLLWDEVIEAGVPFVKAELLRLDPVRAASEKAWRATLERHAPSLVPLIADDLRLRRRRDASNRLPVTQTPAINWPEVRLLVKSDFHFPLSWPVYLFAYRTIVAIAAPLRRLLQTRQR